MPRNERLGTIWPLSTVFDEIFRAAQWEEAALARESCGCGGKGSRKRGIARGVANAGACEGRGSRKQMARESRWLVESEAQKMPDILAAY